MTCIEVDLEDYKDEIKWTFCNNNNCLLNHCSRSFEEKFKQYIEDLEKGILFFHQNKTTEEIISDLKYLARELN